MLKKNLHMCFSGIKCLPTSFSQDPALTIDDDEAEDAKYINYEDDQQQMEEKAEEEAAKSCSNSDTSVAGGGTTTATSDPFSSISDDYYEYSLESEEGSQLLNPDFCSVIAGAASRRRFFVSSPGCTNSILDISSYNCKSNTPSNNSSRNIEDDGNTPAAEQPLLPEGSITTVCTGSTRRSSSTAECSRSSNDTSCSGNPEESSIKGSVAVRKYSPDPYMDFRTSMVEMIEASSSSTKDRHEMEFNDNIYQYEYLHELLMCYLSLNTRDTHKYIIAAFMDLLLTYIMDSRC